MSANSSATEFSSMLDGSILKSLPDYIAAALRDYAMNTGLTETQVIEIAIASFLNVEAPLFSHIDPKDLESYAEMKARLEFLEGIWYATKQGKLTPQVVEQAAALGW